MADNIWGNDPSVPAVPVPTFPQQLADTALPGASLVGFDGTDLASWIDLRVAKVVLTLAELRTVDKTKYSQALLVGYATAGDVPLRHFYYDSSDTTSADNGITIIVNPTDGGRWKWNPPAEGIDARFFGAKFDGTTNDTTALQSALSFGKNIIFPPAIACVSTTLTVTTPITIRAYGATLKWVGSAPSSKTSIIYIGNPDATTEAQVSKFGVFGLSVDGNGVSNIRGFHFGACRYSTFADLKADNCKIVGFYLCGDDSVGLNCADNVFRAISSHDCTVGLTLTGIGNNGVGPGTTVNQFHGVNLFGNMVMGIVFEKNCDSNQFFGVSLLSQYSDGVFTGVVFNNGENKTTQYNDVTNQLIDGVLMSGGTGGINGFEFNHCQDIVIRGAFISTSAGILSQYTIPGPSSVVSFTLETITQETNLYRVTPPPTAVAGANAGTSPPEPVIASGSTFHCGQISFGTGSSPSGGVQVAVSLPSDMPRVPKAIHFQGLNGNTIGLNILPVGVTNTGFNVWANNPPAANQSNTAYQLYYSIEW